MAHGNEINNKKYYWLKLDRHFFGNARIKKLRKLAGGDTYTIIYLKLLLLSIEFEGILVFEGIEETFEKEMALKIEEDEENVTITLNYLKMQGLLIEQGEDGYLPEAASSIGSETKSNVYKRNRNIAVGKIPTIVQPNSNQIPIEKEIEIEKDKDKEKEDVAEATPTSKKRFIKPSIKEISDYCSERNNNINPQRFFDFYESIGWKVGNKPMKDWKACVRTWEGREDYSTRSKVSKANSSKYDRED